jgi:hypothetical protein
LPPPSSLPPPPPPAHSHCAVHHPLLLPQWSAEAQWTAGRWQRLPPLTVTTLNPPFVALPPPTSHLMLIVASSPLLQQQRADANTLTLSSPRQCATAPPPPPFYKILSIDKRRQTTGDGRVGPSADAGVGGEAMESILAGGKREKNGGDADD